MQPQQQLQQQPMGTIALLLLNPNHPTFCAPQCAYYTVPLQQQQAPIDKLMEGLRLPLPYNNNNKNNNTLCLKSNDATTKHKQKHKNKIDYDKNVYHGKRFLDSISNEYDDACSFTNTVFQLTSPTCESKKIESVNICRPTKQHIRRIALNDFYLPTLSSNSSNEALPTEKSADSLKTKQELSEQIRKSHTLCSQSTLGSVNLDSPSLQFSDSDFNIASSTSASASASPILQENSSSSAEDMLLI